MGKELKKIKKNVNKKTQPILSSMIKDEVAVYDESFEFSFRPLGFDEDINITLFPFFKPEKVNNLVNDYFQFLELCRKEEINVELSEQDDILNYYIIKYFTSVKTTQGKKAKTIYDEFKLLVNSKFYTEIMGLFPEESVRSVYERKLDLLEMAGKLEEQYAGIKQQIDELELENKDAIETVFSKNEDKSDTDEIIQ